MTMSPIEQFELKRSQSAAKAERLSTQYNIISAVRISIFVLVLILIVYLANLGEGSLLTLISIGSLIIFVVLIIWHNKVKYVRNQSRFLVQINEEEILKLDNRLSSFPGGEQYQSKNHAYSSDLDIFGRNSLYQLLNRCTTPPGRDTLAKWLQETPTTEDIGKRQQAIEELNTQLEWRQDWQASGMHYDEERKHIDELIEWLNNAENIVPKWVSFVRYILPAITIPVMIGAIFFSIQIGWLFILLIINSLVLAQVFKKAFEVNSQTSHGITTLKAFEVLITKVEKSEFKSPLLLELQKSFVEEDMASLKIKRLKKILHLLNSRNNLFYVIVNFVLLLDVHTLVRASNWKSGHAHDVESWFKSMGQLEAINSIAGYAFANPSFVMPKLNDEYFGLSTKCMGHPLIHSSERVCNDFSIENKGAITVITGSNMSGKSTFLRTLGVNVVLAMAGAPVCADELKLSRLQVFTGMRTQDNLEEHVSSFYAELKRIKQLLDLITSNEIPILFMLDEILKGTNSVDRHTGAVALIHQLHKYNGLGLISTHDLELGKIAEDLEFTDNYSFNSSIQNDEILFDYKLNNGVCSSFNASKLMKKMGIEIGN